MDSRTKALCDFLNAAHSVYHAQGGSALVAFRVPQGSPKGFLMSASHSDRPTFKVKENFELAAAYTRMAVERYGGMLISPWLDRPLSVAGRVTVETEAGVETKLLDIDRDLLLIPNVAIHMNRQANEGYKWNPAVDTLPLIGGAGAAGKLPALLEKEVGGKILGHDLYLYIRQKASVWGVDEEYISSAALDDLECAWGCTQGFLKGGDSASIPVLCVFDSEEVGYVSPQGAGSSLLEDTLGRICDGLKLNRGQMLAQSFLVSADNAHAIHPNHPEYADPGNAPVMGGGLVIKYNANLPGGSTLGRISLAHVSVPTVDIGLAQLAMHSCYETAAVSDAIDLETAMAAYYGSTLEATESGFSIL